MTTPIEVFEVPMILKYATSALSLAALVAAAPAADLFAPSRDYDAVIFGKLTANGGDSEGRLAVGGDFVSTSSYGVADRVADDISKYSLVVGGNLSTVNNWQVFGGKAAVGGSVTGAGVSFELPGAGIDHTHPLDFDSLYSFYNGESGALAGLAANGTYNHQYSTSYITGTNATLNVVTLTAADLVNFAADSDHQISAPAGSTLIINVPGTSASMSNGLALTGIDQTHVVFNFYQATSLTISNMGVFGSVLAPNAALTLNGGNINGFSILGSATQNNGGEFHNYPSVAMAPVPEPASMAALGLGAVGILRRRKR